MFAAAGAVADFFQMDLETVMWTELSTMMEITTTMAPRVYQGFASIGNKLYMFGGFDGQSGYQISIAVFCLCNRAKASYIEYIMYFIRECGEHKVRTLDWVMLG